VGSPNICSGVHRQRVCRTVDRRRFRPHDAQVQYAQQRARGTGNGHIRIAKRQPTSIFRALQIPQGPRGQPGR
jgi:hypothetical protein